MRKIAISDIHGCFYTFQSLLDRLSLTTADELMLLGDFVDRGAHTKLVFDFIFQLIEQGYQLSYLRGNHEQMLLDALPPADAKAAQRFSVNGGLETMTSFGVQMAADIPAPYLDFISRLPFYFINDPYICVHGGLDFRNTLDPLHRQQNMLWLRDWYATIDYTWLGDRYIVHGHTPIPRYTLEDQWNDFETLRVVNIDNGCVFDHPEMGSLCAVDLTQRKLYFEPRHRLDKSGMNP